MSAVLAGRGGGGEGETAVDTGSNTDSKGVSHGALKAAPSSFRARHSGNRGGGRGGEGPTAGGGDGGDMEVGDGCEAENVTPELSDCLRDRAKRRRILGKAEQ